MKVAQDRNLRKHVRSNMTNVELGIYAVNPPSRCGSNLRLTILLPKVVIDVRPVVDLAFRKLPKLSALRYPDFLTRI
jgi:hypothetical protein